MSAQRVSFEVLLLSFDQVVIKECLVLYTRSMRWPRRSEGVGCLAGSWCCCCGGGVSPECGVVCLVFSGWMLYSFVILLVCYFGDAAEGGCSCQVPPPRGTLRCCSRRKSVISSQPMRNEDLSYIPLFENRKSAGTRAECRYTTPSGGAPQGKFATKKWACVQNKMWSGHSAMI